MTTAQPSRPAFIAMFLAVGLLIPQLLAAQSMSSPGYRIPFDDLSAGGDYSASESYKLKDTIAESATPSGEGLTGTQYKACAGFQCLQELPFLTVVFAVQSASCTETSSSLAPYDVSLGTLQTSAVSTAANHICVRVTSNGGFGNVVQVKSANAALASVSDPGDTIPSQTETLAAGDPGYGVCSLSAQNGFTAASPFNGSCGTANGHAVGNVTTSDQTIYSSAGPVTDAYGDILTKAAISTTVPAHSDYRDTLTLTVTGTY